MLRANKSIFTSNIEFIKADVMQEHIDTAKIVGSDIDFLSIEAIANLISSKYFFSL